MQQVSLQTGKGLLYIEGPVSDHYLESLTMDEGLHNFRPPERQKIALMEITNLADGMIYLVRSGNTIIGYVTFHHPDGYSRWSKHPRVLEMGGIEVSPSWRGCRVAENLLQVAFADQKVEDFIVITTEYCWHWDMKDTGLDVWDYQRMLTKLFGKVNLQKVTTDDPDILEHPANVLMARFGQNVIKEDKMLFEAMRFTGRTGNMVNII